MRHQRELCFHVLEFRFSLGLQVSQVIQHFDVQILHLAVECVNLLFVVPLDIFEGLKFTTLISEFVSMLLMLLFT